MGLDDLLFIEVKVNSKHNSFGLYRCSYRIDLDYALVPWRPKLKSLSFLYMSENIEIRHGLLTIKYLFLSDLIKLLGCVHLFIDLILCKTWPIKCSWIKSTQLQTMIFRTSARMCQCLANVASCPPIPNHLGGFKQLRKQRCRSRLWCMDS